MTADPPDFGPFEEPPPIVHTAGPRWSHSIGNLATDLAKAQLEMEGATKDATNPHFRNRYPTLASVVEACRPLAKYGIAHLQPTRTDGARVTITTMLLHKSGEWIAEDLTLTASQNTPQAIGSALTYGRRYGLAAMAGIAPTDETDDDGEAAEGRGAAPIVTTPVKVPPKPAPTTKPPGFDTWWPDLQAVADEGPRALTAAWNKSAPDLKAWAEANHKKELANLKAIARTVVTPRSSEEAPF